MKNNFRLAAIITALLLFKLSSGQFLVKGLIKDKHGVPLIGASVTIDGKKSGTVTDLSGHYVVRLKPGRHVIAASYIGYAEQRVQLNACHSTTIERNFIMTEVYKNCSEVVVVSSSNRNKITSSDLDQNKTLDSKLPPRQLDLLLMKSFFEN